MSDALHLPARMDRLSRVEIEAAEKTISQYSPLKSFSFPMQHNVSVSDRSYFNETLQRSLVTGSRFKNCDFSEAAATGVIWTDNDFLGCCFDRANFEFSDLSGSKFLPLSSSHPTTINGTGLNGAVLRDTTLSSLTTRGSSFTNTDFSGAKINQCDLGGTFEGAIFDGASMNFVSFHNANIDYADFTRTKFTNSELSFEALPYLFGIDIAQIGDGLRVFGATDRDKKEINIDRDNLLEHRGDLINFFLSRNAYFAAANMALLLDKHDGLSDIFMTGLNAALLLSDYRTVKLICKLIRSAEDRTRMFGPRNLRGFYEAITAGVATSRKPTMRNQYELHDGKIRAYLMAGHSDTLQIQFRSKASDAKEANLIANEITSLILECGSLVGLDLAVVSSQFAFNSNPTHQIEVRIVHVHEPDPSKNTSSPWNQVNRIQVFIAAASLLFGGINAAKSIFDHSNPPIIQQTIQQNIINLHPRLGDVVIPRTFQLKKGVMPLTGYEGDQIFLYRDTPITPPQISDA